MIVMTNSSVASIPGQAFIRASRGVRLGNPSNVGREGIRSALSGPMVASAML